MIRGPRRRSRGRHARAAPPRTPRLRLAQDLVQRHELRVGIADERRAGGVAAVAAQHAADVEHDRVSDLDTAIAGHVMRAGGVRPRGDDREPRLVVAGGKQELADVPADLGLAATRQPLGRDGAHRLVRGNRGRPQPVDLLVVLTRRSALIVGPASTSSAGSSAARRRSTKRAHIWSCTPTRSAAPTIAWTTRIGSSISSHGTTSMSSASSPSSCSASGSSSRGRTSTGSPSAGTTRQVSRSIAGARYPSRYA